MRDYEGDLDIFQIKLDKAGVTREEFDIRNWVGCTFSELKALTENAILRHKIKEEEKDVKEN